MTEASRLLDAIFQVEMGMLTSEGWRLAKAAGIQRKLVGGRFTQFTVLDCRDIC